MSELIKLITPEIGKLYTSVEDGRKLKLVEEGVLGNPSNENPLLRIPYYMLEDETGKKWYVRKVMFWKDLKE